MCVGKFSFIIIRIDLKFIVIKYRILPDCNIESRVIITD